MKRIRISTALALFTGVFILDAYSQLAQRSGSVSKSQSVEFQIESSKKIDRLVGADFRRKQIRPLGKATDSEFLRRTYLNAIGRIPSYEESVEFLKAH